MEFEHSKPGSQGSAAFEMTDIKALTQNLKAKDVPFNGLMH